MRRKRTCLMPIAALGAAAVLAPPAQGATITVTTNADEAPPVANGNCTLREAVNAAKSNGSPAVDACTNGDAGSLDTIELGAGTYSLTGTAGENSNQGGDLDIDARVGMEGPLAIDGTAAGVTVEGAFDDRVLHHMTGELSLSDFTVTGGGILSVSDGQGILSTGAALTLTRMTVTENSGPVSGGGGGIAYLPGSPGELTIIDSQITENGTSRTGGGISVSNADLEMTGSLVTGNTVSNDSVCRDHRRRRHLLRRAGRRNDHLVEHLRQHGAGGRDQQRQGDRRRHHVSHVGRVPDPGHHYQRQPGGREPARGPRACRRRDLPPGH